MTDKEIHQIMMKALSGHVCDCQPLNRVYDAAVALRDSGAEETEVLALISEQIASIVISPLEFERMKSKPGFGTIK